MQAVVSHNDQHEEGLEAALALALEEDVDEDVDEERRGSAAGGGEEDAPEARQQPWTGPPLQPAAAAKDDGIDVKPTPSKPSAFGSFSDVRVLALPPLFLASSPFLPPTLHSHRPATLLHTKTRTFSADC